VIDHVGDLLAGALTVISSALSAPSGRRSPGVTWIGVSSGAPLRIDLLERVEPWPRLEPGGGERLGPHVQVRPLVMAYAIETILWSSGVARP